VNHQDAAGSDAPKDHWAAGARRESSAVVSAFPRGRDNHHHHHHHNDISNNNIDNKRIRGGGGSSMQHDGEEGTRRVPDPGSEEGVWLDNARRRSVRSMERFGGAPASGRAEMTRHDHANSRGGGGGGGGGEGGVENPHHISSSSSSSMSASTSSSGPRARQEWQHEKREDKEKHKYWFMSEQRAGANRRMTPPQVWLKRPLWGELPDGSPPPQAKKKLTARVWDSVMSQPDPTEALQEISRRAMLKDEDGGWVHDDLWWMREMIEIKYGEMDEAEQKKARSGKGKVLINHVVQVVKQAPTRLRVRWAALLHDVGKPSTMEVDTEKNKLRFHKHESVGGQMVDSILASYGYHEQFRREVATLVLRSGRIRCIENFHDQGARR
jgi:putative nucleotidyltransferase with HDIG domain